MTISISARKKKRKKAKQDARLNPPAVVEHAAAIMKLFRPTPFSGEADIINTVRRNRVLQGWPFAKADEAARALAESALKKIGWGVRPEFVEGQPFLTSEGKTCSVCGAEFVRLYGPGLDRFREAGIHLYCSLDCSRMAKRRDFTKERECKFCTKPFVPLRDRGGDHRESEFCSSYCYNASRAATRHEARECEHCRESFVPHRGPKGEDQRFCSQDCSKAALASQRKAPPRPCDNCGTVFQSTQYALQAPKYCSRACYLDANKRAPKPCLECGSIFTPAKADRKFCSNRCSALYRNAQRANAFTCEAA